MKIAIIVAMGKELELLEPMIVGRKSVEADGCQFVTGRVGIHEVTAMECGIGKVNAAIGTLTLINRFAPDLVVSTGVAGGADKSVNVMDIVVAERIAYHDVWCGPGTVPGQAAGVPLYLASDPAILRLVEPSPAVRRGLLCSGDIFIDSIEQVDRIKGIFPDALAVDMESAAIAHVCHRKGVRFFGLRVISDSPGASHDNAAQYEDFWADAPKHTFAIVSRLLNDIE